MEIDFDKTPTTAGGRVSQIPEPHIRRWPGATRPRIVRVTTNNNASFYQFDIMVQGNPIYDVRSNEFRMPFDDREPLMMTLNRAAVSHRTIKAVNLLDHELHKIVKDAERNKYNLEFKFDIGFDYVVAVIDIVMHDRAPVFCLAQLLYDHWKPDDDALKELRDHVGIVLKKREKNSE